MCFSRALGYDELRPENSRAQRWHPSSACNGEQRVYREASLTYPLCDVVPDQTVANACFSVAVGGRLRWRRWWPQPNVQGRREGRGAPDAGREGHAKLVARGRQGSTTDARQTNGPTVRVVLVPQKVRTNKSVQAKFMFRGRLCGVIAICERLERLACDFPMFSRAADGARFLHQEMAYIPNPHFLKLQAGGASRMWCEVRQRGAQSREGQRATVATPARI